jgi:cobalt-precorrin 5A hydrolase/precorrin-3B C17-methyltransferase
MRIAVLTLTRGGRETGARIKAVLGEHQVELYAKKEHLQPGDRELRLPLRGFVGELIETFDALVFVTAMGVAVRTLSEHLRGKLSDPRVVVVDETGEHAVSLLSGHRGANELARDIAGGLGGTPVITTSTDVQGKTCVEYLANQLGLALEQEGDLKEINAAIANGGVVEVYTEIDLGRHLPEGFILRPWGEIDNSTKPKVVITSRLVRANGPAVFMRPRNLILGVGARRGTGKEDLLRAIGKVLETERLSIKSVKALATIEARAEEKGFVETADTLGVPLVAISPEEIRKVEENYPSSGFVRERIGVGAVCEPCAVLAGNNASLIVGKTKLKGITVAVAEEERQGRIFIVGLGPGSEEHLTPRAKEVLRKADMVVGYKGYLEYVQGYLEGKEVISRGMGGEVERAKIALEAAGRGKNVAVVSSGDPGIYAMASVVLECASKAGVRPDVEVVPGITAASAAAARLGAPLGHDFAAISLSDLLTPWEVIEDRLRAAARGDFCIVLYNPRSRGRQGHLNRAIEILREYLRPDTPVGVVKNAMRRGERVLVTTLEKLPCEEVDMLSTVIIGNSESFTYHPWIITPRGYRGI